MDKLSIKLNIANRFYPMKIDRSSEEIIRNSVKKIDDRLKFYEENYAIKDKQDILAMCLIEYASKLEKINQNKFISDDGISEKLTNLDESEYLERKQTLRTDIKKKQFQSYITDSSLKTIVAFLNGD